MRPSSLIIVMAPPLLAFALWVRHQHKRDGKGLRAGLFLGTAGSFSASLYAGFFWQVFGWGWLMFIPLTLGMLLIGVLGSAQGRSRGSAILLALALAGIPNLLIQLALPRSNELMRTMHARNRIAEVVDIPGRVYTLKAKRQRELVRDLTAALDYEDLYVRWGALRTLRECGKEAAPAAERVARSLLDLAKREQDLDPVVLSHLRTAADSLLGALGPRARGAAPPLRQAAEDPDGGVRQEALRLLARIGMENGKK